MSAAVPDGPPTLSARQPLANAGEIFASNAAAGQAVPDDMVTADARSRFPQDRLWPAPAFL